MPQSVSTRSGTIGSTDTVMSPFGDVRSVMRMGNSTIHSLIFFARGPGFGWGASKQETTFPSRLTMIWLTTDMLRAKEPDAADKSPTN